MKGGWKKKNAVTKMLKGSVSHVLEYCVNVAALPES